MKAFTKVVSLFSLLVAFGLTSMSLQAGDNTNPAFWKITVTGDFDTILTDLKNHLQVEQFQIIGEENLAKGLENNKHALGEDKWNTIGFKEATSVRFCSLVFNHEVFNLNMDWSILCPFKLVAYTMKSSPRAVTIMTLRPNYLLRHDSHPKARAIANKIEQRIISAIEEGVM